MPAHSLELILTRRWAEVLSIPVFITDVSGNLLYYNPPAEIILGRRFEDTGEMPVAEWATIFTPTDEDGSPLPPEGLPLVKTLGTQVPAQGSFYIENLEGATHFIHVSAFPIIGMAEGFLGAVALFWITDVT
jgi:PAS domain-containing protein